MRNPKREKILAWFVIVILIINLILFATGKIDYITFWIVIICGALSSWGIKKLNK